MEFLLPHSDEFVLDFDAEEALLRAQLFATGQLAAAPAPASAGAHVGLGIHPVKQNKTLATAVARLRTAQQPQVGASTVPAETQQLDNQLDALRREIARLEQQKQKQGNTKATAPAAAANGTAGARKVQKSITLAAKPAGGLSQGAPQQGAHAAGGQPAVKRVRAHPNQAAAAKTPGAVTSGASPAKAGGIAAAVDAGAAAAPAQQTVGAKRPADSAVGQTQQQRAQPKRQSVPRKPQQREQQSGGPYVAEAPAQVDKSGAGALPQHEGNAGPLPAVGTVSHGNQAGDIGTHGTEYHPSGQPRQSQQQQQQKKQSPGQAGPGPPRKRLRASGEPTAASESQPALAADGRAAPNGEAAAGRGQRVQASANAPVAPNVPVTAYVAHTSTHSSSAQSGNPGALASMQGNRTGPDAAVHNELFRHERTGSGTGDLADCQAGTGVPGVPAQHGHANAAAGSTDGADISPEVEQAATAFLMNFMTQISGPGQEQERPAEAELPQQQQQHNANAMPAQPPALAAGAVGHSSAQQQQHQRQSDAHHRQPQVQRQQPVRPLPGASLGGSTPQPEVGSPAASQGGVLVSAEAGVTDGGQQAAVGMNAPASGGAGGGASARRAAAERTIAAVQRLRRKSSGPAPVEGPLRTVSSAGTPTIARGDTTAAEKPFVVPPARAAGVSVAPSSATTLPAPHRTVREGGNPTMEAAVHASGWETNGVPTAGRGGTGQPCRDAGGSESAVARPPPREAAAAGLGRGAEPMVVSPASGADRISPGGMEADMVALTSGAMSSPVPAPQGPGGSQGNPLHPAGAAGSDAAPLVGSGSPGARAGSDAHQPPWVQRAAGGWDPHLAYPVRQEAGRTFRGGANTQRPQQQHHQAHSVQRPNEPRVTQGATGSGHPSVTTGPTHLNTPAAHGAPVHVPGGSAAGAGAAATTGNTTPQPPQSASHAPHIPHQSGPGTIPFRPSAPYGILPPPARPPPFMFPQPPPGMVPPHFMLPGGLFPVGLMPGPPPGTQWRPGTAPGGSLGAGPPMVSPVEVDVLARKELILLKWQMLREMAVELEAEWSEACHAHNRLRLLSMTHAEPVRVAASTPAGEAGGSVPAAAAVPTVGGQYSPPADAAQPFSLFRQPPPFPSPGDNLQQPGREQLQMQVQQQQQWPQSLQQQSAGEEPMLLSGDMQPPVRNRPASVPPAPQATLGLDAMAAGPSASHASLPIQVPGESSGPPVHGARSADQTHTPGYGGRQSTALARMPEPDLMLPDVGGDSSAPPQGQPQEPEQLHDRQAEDGRVPISQVPRQVQVLGENLESRQTSDAGVPQLPEPAHAPAGQQRWTAGVGQADAAPPQPPCMPLEGEASAAASSGAGRRAEVSARVMPALASSRGDVPGCHQQVVAATMGAAAGTPGTIDAGASHARGDDLPSQPLHRQDSQSALHRGAQPAGVSGGLRACGEGTTGPAVAGSREDDRRAERGSGGSGPGAAAGEAVGNTLPNSVEALPTRAAPEGGSAPEACDAPLQPAPRRGEPNGAGQRAGDGDGHIGGGASSQQPVALWTPWATESPVDAAVATSPGAADSQGNGMAALAHSTQAPQSGGGSGRSEGGHGDAGHGTIPSETAPFTGLSFKLSVTPGVGGRRVAAMRVQTGTVASPAAKAGVGEASKRAQASVSAVVAAPIVQLRRRSPSLAVGQGAGAAATAGSAGLSKAAAPAAAVAVAARSPAEPSLRVQSAPQVQATGPRGGSPGLGAFSHQGQQAWQLTCSSLSGSVGLPEGAAAPVNHTAPHVQDSSGSAPHLGASQLPLNDAVQQHPVADASPPEHLDQIRLATRREQQQQQQQQREQHHQQPARSQLVTSPSLTPTPPYLRRLGFILTQGGVEGAPGSIFPRAQPSTSYSSPLSMFRSYSRGISR